MSDTNETAAAPAEGETVSTPIVQDTIIDHDAPEETAPKPDDKPKPEAEAKPEGEEGDNGDESKPKKPSGSARAKMREQRLLQELTAAQQELEQIRQRGQQTDQPAQKTAPKEEDFNGDYFAWQRALTAFEAGETASKAIRDEFDSREKRTQAERQAAHARERATAHAERVEDARDHIPDFDEVMGKMRGVQVRDDVIEEIMASDKSALLSYHLANNPEKLFQLNSMSPRELAREMGRLEASVQLPSAKKQTSAPAPLTAVRGGASPSSQEASLEAYLKKTYG